MSSLSVAAPPARCADDIPAAAGADPEREAQLAKICDAAARCELACLRAQCASGGDCADACREIKRRARRRGEDEPAALNAATLGFERRVPSVCADERRRWLEHATPPRSLAALHEAEESQPPAELGCPGDEPRSDITEISIERSACFGTCPVYSFSLHSDGSAEYFGEGYVERLGRRLGRTSPRTFQRLARIAEDLGFFQLQSSYSRMVSDNPTVYTSVVRGGVRKTIRHYAPSMTGPPRLGVFEDTVDDYADYVEWSN